MKRRLALLLAACGLAGAAPADERARDREVMALTVDNMAATTPVAEARLLDWKVLAAMRAVPRHLFVPEEIRPYAYQNTALPIGHDQTISQPYIVALMTDLLDVEKGHRVLEIGTGSGYQAALLSVLAGEVYSIEIVEPLAAEAAERLKTLGYANVTVRAGDGYLGWPDRAPFDRIIVTAGAPHIPQPLVDQLKPGGRMVIPVSQKNGDGEQLMLVRKDATGRVRTRSVLPVRFVPLVRARR
jgi:protein-L-isoaspartate(D-aspartate) O-methyltransferase